jgi:long-chain acyl-CoA synthetase
VWLRGNNVALGYYKMPELTASEFGADGFFHTGDIGMLTPGGALKIIDRKKNLVKLKGGEYVALERMNTTYNCSPFINVEGGGVSCYADDSLDRAVCVAQCKAAELVKAAEAANVAFSDASELPAKPEVQEAVLASLKAEAKRAGLVSLEVVAGVYPLLEPWSTENGCLTATQKLVPKAVWRHNSKELQAVMKKGIRN